MSAPRYDVVVVGSGAAGLTAALEAARAGAHVAVVTKDGLGASTSELAQGGIAAVLDDAIEDSSEVHLDDTLRAGAGLCDASAVRVLVEEAPDAIARLVAVGAVFDTDASGRFALSREGGHRGARVVHAGGAATGAEVVRALTVAARAARIEVVEQATVLRLERDGEACTGVRVAEREGGERVIDADAVVLATGGAGQCFALTTNPPATSADGIAMALRAGVAVADLEFVQFHPTALATHTAPRPLLSEALRGEGAVLVDGAGERFVDELLPRDAVSRAIAERCARDGSDHVFLDARRIDRFDERFPSLAAILRRSGLSAASDLLPVAPAAHYLCGGVLTDLDARTSLAGLYAIGEVACTGVHGANRLASNSLLEGLVFATRCIAAVTDGVRSAPGALGAGVGPGDAIGLEEVVVALPEELAVPGAGPPGAARARLQQVMTEYVGVRRSADSLALARAELGELAAAHLGDRSTREALELSNLLVVAMAITAAAMRRRESRGADTRLDRPDTDPDFVRRFVPRLSTTEVCRAR